MSREEHCQAAQAKLSELLALLKQVNADGVGGLIVEGEGLQRSINAFHLEGIRFRMFHFDRRLRGLPGGAPDRAIELFAELRAALEAAGFHTRSH